ncbi:MAG: hypothetical protein K0R92_1238 [Lachnospiraceae bacterium]|jgi:hypothetical protein|nr:hypothetical protein [Lachnospiraceae bacterium]
MDKPFEPYPSMNCRIISEKVKYRIIMSYALYFILCAFIFNTPLGILNGLKDIIASPSILISDYMAVGNVGAAFVNSGILMLIALAIAHKNNSHMTGSLIAAVFTVGGFAFFGKNVYNIISIILGVYLHSRIQKEKFSKYLLIAFFGTSLGPLVSQISFGLDLPPLLGIFSGHMAGLIAGLVLPALAGHFVKFHQGFSLYNIGFVSGMVGTFFMSVIRAFGKNSERALIVSVGNDLEFAVIFGLLFVSLLVLGFYFNNKSFRNYKRLFRHSGRLIEDFVLMDGFAITLINMGTLGLLSTALMLIIGGELNGPIIGGILTVVGFGAFGKHPKNVIPVMAGVFFGALLQVWDITSTAVLITVLYSTTLAPIAGKFGWKAGLLAGFLHITIVMNIGDLHGGMNLYNNGFAGGMVAGTLVPIFESFRKEEI